MAFAPCLLAVTLRSLGPNNPSNLEVPSAAITAASIATVEAIPTSTIQVGDRGIDPNYEILFTNSGWTTVGKFGATPTSTVTSTNTPYVTPTPGATMEMPIADPNAPINPYTGYPQLINSPIFEYTIGDAVTISPNLSAGVSDVIIGTAGYSSDARIGLFGDQGSMYISAGHYVQFATEAGSGTLSFNYMDWGVNGPMTEGGLNQVFSNGFSIVATPDRSTPTPGVSGSVTILNILGTPVATVVASGGLVTGM